MGPLRRLALAALLAAAFAAAAPVAEARPATPLVTMHTTGGFAGIDHLLSVGRHRHATINSRGGGTRRFVVSRATMRRLRSALHDARWSRLRADYPAKQPIADGFHYATTHDGHEVRTEDGASRPKRLDRVLRILQGIVSRHGGFV